MKKMIKESEPLIREANRVMDLLRSKKVNTLSLQRATDELEELFAQLCLTYPLWSNDYKLDRYLNNYLFKLIISVNKE